MIAVLIMMMRLDIPMELLLSRISSCGAGHGGFEGQMPSITAELTSWIAFLLLEAHPMQGLGQRARIIRRLLCDHANPFLAAEPMTRG